MANGFVRDDAYDIKFNIDDTYFTAATHKVSDVPSQDTEQEHNSLYFIKIT